MNVEESGCGSGSTVQEPESANQNIYNMSEIHLSVRWLVMSLAPPVG